MALNLPRFDLGVPLVKDDNTPSIPFHQWWQTVVETLEKAIDDIVTALEAADIAIVAADEAKAAADVAQAAADSAQAAGDGAERIASLTNSGVTGLTLTGTDAGSDATINISAHTRVYGNGTSVAVDSGSVAGLSYSTLYYVYYVDEDRTGGSVVYQTTTTESDAVQTGDKHLVGSVTTPAAAAPDNPGLTVRPPGVGSLE